MGKIMPAHVVSVDGYGDYEIVIGDGNIPVESIPYPVGGDATARDLLEKAGYVMVSEWTTTDYGAVADVEPT